MDGTDLREAASACLALLDEQCEQDWDVPIPELDWTVRQAAAHIAQCLFWYSHDLAAGAVELGVAQITVPAKGTNAELARTVRAGATLLAAVADAAPTDARGWHPDGSPDVSGFVAMGCDELLVHALDIAHGLGVSFAAPRHLAERTLHRLFPEAPQGDPWSALLWANGRIPLPGHPRRTSWRWHCSPLGG